MIQKNSDRSFRAVVPLLITILSMLITAFVLSSCSSFKTTESKTKVTTSTTTVVAFDDPSLTSTSTVTTDVTTVNDSSSGQPVVKPQTTTAQNPDNPTVTTTTEITTVTDPEIIPEDPVLELGDSGDEVKKLQSRLIELGYLNDVADGVYGTKTEKAVTVFQKYSGILQTGYAYQSMLNLLYSEDVLAAPVTEDHEDVKDPDYKSDYYIVVYNQNCSVLVLGKDDFGKYNVPIKTFICSVGKGGEDGTPEGVYSIDKRYRWRYLFGDVYGQYAVRFYGNYLFHSVPYYSQSPDDLKMEEFEKLGSPASLGCVRLCVRDVKWIYDNAQNGTQVRVLDGKNGSLVNLEIIPPLSNDPLYNGWDPTDPDENNPYNQ